MSEVERAFDRFIDTFADDLLEIVSAFLNVEMGRALVVAQLANSKQSKVDLRERKKSQRVAAKAKLKADRQRQRQEQRAARLAGKERVNQERIAERAERQVEHDRLRQQRTALKLELETERRRLREATRKRPARQLPLDFDGLQVPQRRRGVPAANSPPQLFVHRRRRDGQIEKLARNDAPAAATSAAVATHSSPSAPPPAE